MPTGSVLTKTDWNREWLTIYEGRRSPDSAASWDARAEQCRQTGHLLPGSSDPYIETFLEYAGIRPFESVLDIGCGPGALAVPLAQAGHAVTAIDFSQEMLGIMMQAVRERGALDITPVLVDWRDDWGKMGIEAADVVIASRTVPATDLKSAIFKVNAWSKRRACISTTACGSPNLDRVLANALGRHICQCSSFAYCMNILFSMDMRPELRFIDSQKDGHWPSREEAVSTLLRSVAPLSSAEEQRFERFCKEHLVEVGLESGDGSKSRVWKRDYVRVVEWAFIAWDKLGK